MNLLNRNRTVHCNERRDVVLLMHEDTLIIREHVLLVRHIRAHIYPEGWTLAPQEQFTSDYFNNAANQGKARENRT
jgi:hypothetical protein